MKLKEYIKSILPEYAVTFIQSVKNNLISMKSYVIIKRQPKLHHKALCRVIKKAKNKQTIRVAFFAIYPSVWKYEGVYRLLEKDDRFEPIVLVCPVVNYGKKHMLNEMSKAYDYYRTKGYRVLRSYNVEEDDYLDINKDIAPDIIFYTNPYKGLIDNRYYITKFKHTLTCYTNYTYFVSNIEEETYNNAVGQLSWRYFHETSQHLEMFRKYSKINSVNSIISGYPGVDDFEYSIRNDKYSWKNIDSNKKRIIWAPHHTINNNDIITYSNFLRYHSFILDLAKKYMDSIEIVLKPHPLLKAKLYQHEDWGEKRTNEYFTKWEQGKNTSLEECGYIDLFNSSDALIQDSASFVAEYLYCGKPSLYLMSSNIESQFNEFGREALKVHYHAYTSDDIVSFIEQVIIGNDDYMKDERDKFYFNVLKIKDGVSASENIYYSLCEDIF